MDNRNHFIYFWKDNGVIFYVGIVYYRLRNGIGF